MVSYLVVDIGTYSKTFIMMEVIYYEHYIPFIH